MLLAPILLAVSLGQCPDPPSRYGPPPCAARNVPGCLPGYHRQIDAQGRVVYVCDQPAAAPYSGGPAPSYAPPPPSYPPPPPPAYVAPAPVYAREQLGLVGIVLTPGITATDGFRRGDAAGGVALEFRPPFSPGRLRMGFEFSDPSRIIDFSFKWDILNRGFVRPFLAAGLGAAYLDFDQDWHFEMGVSGGIDFFLTRNLFTTFEVKQRWFTDESIDRQVIFSNVHQTTFFAGIGFYL